VSPVRYELGFYIPEHDNLHSDSLENLVSILDNICYLLNFTADICRLYEMALRGIKLSRDIVTEGFTSFDEVVNTSDCSYADKVTLVLYAMKI
jgi:hypothetical protein